MRGELVQPPRLKNSRIPRPVNDIVLKALHPDVTAMPARRGRAERCAGRSGAEIAQGDTDAQPASFPRQLKTWPKSVAPAGAKRPSRDFAGTAEAAARPYCRCPFCGEAQCRDFHVRRITIKGNCPTRRVARFAGFGSCESRGSWTLAVLNLEVGRLGVGSWPSGN